MAISLGMMQHHAPYTVPSALFYEVDVRSRYGDQYCATHQRDGKTDASRDRIRIEMGFSDDHATAPPVLELECNRLSS